jgi:GTP-binding protein
MKPVIVLVGRPNVGKSTLFNRLTRGRDALVADIPGLTRDRQYGEGRRGDRPYLVVDTGGVVEDLERAAGGKRRSVDEIMQEQTRQAVEEGDAIILLVDGRDGITPADRELANYLRRSNKPVTVAVNKSEGLDPQVVAAEFHQLGLHELVSISAKRGDGVNGLIKQVLADYPVAEEVSIGVDVPRVAVAGRPNVGKSTLINSLLGEERVVVFDAPGTTRDSIRIPFERSGKPYLFIDTAGVRRKGRVQEAIEKFSIIKTLQAIEEANVVILVLDADQGLSEQDASLAGYILEKGRALVVAVNKCDKVDQERRQWIERELARRFAFITFVRPHFISALHGTGVAGLFKSIDRAFASACKTLSTSQLNRVLQQAVQATPPPMVRGRRIKPKFAHQGGKNPPLIVIHGNQVKDLPESYRRYLASAFRKAFRLEGTPVRIECREGANPYAAKMSNKSVSYGRNRKQREHRRHR